MVRQRWERWSLQTKLLTSVLLILTSAVGISGVLFYLASARAVEARTVALTGALAEQITRNVDSYVADIDRLSQIVLRDGIIVRVLNQSDPAVVHDGRPPLDPSEMYFEMLMLATPVQSIQGMYVFASDGTIFYATHGKTPRVGYAVEREPWYTALSAQPSAPFLLWPTGGETTVFQRPAKVFSLVRPVSAFPGKTTGYLKIDLKVSSLDSLVPVPGDALRGDRVLVVADDGHVIYDNAGALTGQTAPELRSRGPNSGGGRLAWEGEPRVYATRRSVYTGWTTWLLVPAGSIAVESRQAGLMVLLVCSGAMLLMGILLYILTRQVTQPLRRMADTMHRVETGDLSVRAPRATADDEVGRLGRVLNTMLDSLERLIKQVLEARLREQDAQLLALQAQINPHYLFNTLNSIRALSRKHDSDRAAEMVESLADMFHYSMSDWQQPASLGDELAHVQNYVRIQEVRFGGRFSVDYLVPQELLDAAVVKLSLQPLVENAITHGLDDKPDGLRVTIGAQVRESVLEIQVADNGAGIAEPALKQLRKRLADTTTGTGLPTADHGIGIVNIDRRLKLLFGQEYGIAIESAAGRGTTVALRQPRSVGVRHSTQEDNGHEHRCG